MIALIKYSLLLVMISLIFGACTNRESSGIEVKEAYYFEKTGHTVRAEFWRFFQIYGGLDSLGYPITEEMTREGWTVQYFENGRLELHPENEPAYRITVGWLGDLLQRRRPPLPVTSIPRRDDPYRRYFAPTGHTLSGDFLDYFETHGGTIRFGQPISEPFLLEGRLTQDFQSARFFWTPENETPVLLEKIGQVHLEASRLSP